MKPGWKTTEFYVTLLTAIPGLLVAAGVVPTSDMPLLSDAASKIAGGIIAAVAVAKYIGSRTHVKTNGILALLVALALPSLCQAQHLLPWRERMHQRLLALEKGQQQVAPQIQQQAPQQPLLIVLGGPQQQIPLGGPPHQETPLGGPPRQDI